MASRTLTVTSAAIPHFQGRPALEPVRLSGREGMNSLFEYELLLKTPDSLNLLASEAADFDLDTFVDREISCGIALDGMGAFIAGVVGASVDAVGAGERQINALIAEAAFVGEEGRHLLYRLTLRPWLSRATLRSDCRIFQNQTVVHILDAVLGAYAFPVAKRLIETYPERDYQTQYNESDFDFVSRLCQEWGINYHFEHSAGTHRLVLTDAMGAYLPNPSAAYRRVDYHPPGWKTDAEYLHGFVPLSRLTSGAYATRDHDYTRPKADLHIEQRDPRFTGQVADQDSSDASGEVYAWHAQAGGSHYAQPRAGRPEANDPQAEGRLLAGLRMQALRTAGARAEAQGNLRGMEPGCTFALQNHPRQTANADYLILDTRFLIEDIAQDSQIKDAAPSRRQQWRVEVQLTAHPTSEPLRPPLTQRKPGSVGLQSALVVGPRTEEDHVPNGVGGVAQCAGPTGGKRADPDIWTDDLGRIKVQFRWDRKGQKNQHSSCWVRVSSPWAGNQLGSIQLPRIGQEVIVDFIGGDPDLPICTGRVHNALNQPPWELPGQAALSGFRSRELTPGGGNGAAGRSNHLLLDDTAGKIQAQLKSDHQSSSLSLGHITRVAGHAGRQAEAGEGAELRTDGYVSIRSALAMLLSTDGCTQGEGGILSRHELIVQLERALALAKELAQAAQTCEAGTRDTAAQQALQEAVQALGHGMTGDDVERTGQAPGGQPVLAMSGAAGIASATPLDHTQYAGGQIDSVAGRNQQHYAGESILQTAGRDIGQFAVAGDIRSIANQGNLIQQAQHGRVEIAAQKSLTLSSTQEDVVVRAGKSITLVLEDGTFLRLADGKVVFGMQGPFTVKSAGANYEGPGTLATELRSFPTMAFDDSFVLMSHSGELMSQMKYRLIHRDGGVVDGVTGADGVIPAAKGVSPDELTLHLLGLQR